MNFLPNKHVEIKDTLIFAGAVLLDELKISKSVSELWDKTKTHDSIQTFPRFIATLDMLFIVGAITFENNKLKVVK